MAVDGIGIGDGNVGSGGSGLNLGVPDPSGLWGGSSDDDPEPAPDADDPSTAPSATGAPEAGDDAGSTVVSEPDPEPEPDTTSSPAGQGASTNEGAQNNRFAAMFSRLGSTGGSEDVAGGSTASSVIADVGLNTDVWRQNVEGAREQLAEFRENNPLSEILDESEAPNEPTSGSGTIMPLWKKAGIAVAGVVAVGAAFAVGGDS